MGTKRFKQQKMEKSSSEMCLLSLRCVYQIIKYQGVCGLCELEINIHRKDCLHILWILYTKFNCRSDCLVNNNIIINMSSINSIQLYFYCIWYNQKKMSSHLTWNKQQWQEKYKGRNRGSYEGPCCWYLVDHISHTDVIPIVCSIWYDPVEGLLQIDSWFQSFDVYCHWYCYTSWSFVNNKEK